VDPSNFSIVSGSDFMMRIRVKCPYLNIDVRILFKIMARIQSSVWIPIGSGSKYCDYGWIQLFDGSIYKKILLVYVGIPN